jgi:hypothetical protein
MGIVAASWSSGMVPHRQQGLGDDVGGLVAPTLHLDAALIDLGVLCVFHAP